MIKNLISKICERVKKPILIGTSAATFAVMPYISGCANEEEAMMGSLIGTMGMMSPNATPSDAMFYAGMRDISQNSLNSINAGKSKVEVNVNVYNQNPNQDERFMECAGKKVYLKDFEDQGWFECMGKKIYFK